MLVQLRVNISKAAESKKNVKYGSHLLGPVTDEFKAILLAHKLDGKPAPITAIELLSAPDDIIPQRSIVELHSIPAGEIEQRLTTVDGQLVPLKNAKGEIEHRWHIFALPDDTTIVEAKRLSELARVKTQSKEDLTGFKFA